MRLLKDELTKLPSDKIEGILFKFYSIISNNRAKARMNQRSLEYHNKINTKIVEERSFLREKQLESQDRFIHN